MTSKNDKYNEIIANARQNQDERDKGYREQALKLYPWICGRCQREFTRTNLSELTVHHRDHNHDNNPSDGSNWELLCIYCHDNEHQRYLENPTSPAITPEKNKSPQQASFSPFANLKELMNKKD